MIECDEISMIECNGINTSVDAYKRQEKLAEYYARKADYLRSVPIPNPHQRRGGRYSIVQKALGLCRFD